MLCVLAGNDQAAAAYSPPRNIIIFASDTPLRVKCTCEKCLAMEEAYDRSSIVHELVHFLQTINGWDLTDPKQLLDSERQAYSVQAAYIEKKEFLDPSYFGLTGWKVEECIRKSAETGVVRPIPTRDLQAVGLE